MNESEGCDEDALAQARDLITKNPQMGASAFLMALQKQGLSLVDLKKAIGKEADSISSQPAGIVSKKRESAAVIREPGGLNFKCKIGESKTSARTDGIGPTKFRVVLIQEGLGNLKDAFYYSRPALESAISIFEGKKIFADHPDSISEQTRPERSVKDILGHFEDVKIEESEDGSAMLTAELITLPGMTFSWARELMSHQIDYSKKYPEQEFVGISINASGDAEEIPLEQFLKEATIPEGAKPKLLKALNDGVSSIRIVKQIEDAVSADLVTSPGARGRILDFIEQEKKNMAKHDESKMKHNENEDEKKMPMEGDDGDSGDAGHDDADKDKGLIKKMLKKHMGLDDEGDHEEALHQAHQAYEAYREMGENEDEAAHSAAKAVKLHNFSKKKQAESGNKEDAKIAADGYHYNEGEEEDKSKKEAEVSKLAGRVAFLERELKNRDLTSYMDKKLKETGLYREDTTKIRTLIGTPKNKEQVDSTIKLFMEAYQSGKARAVGTGLVFGVEKTGSVETSLDFSDCIE